MSFETWMSAVDTRLWFLFDEPSCELPEFDWWGTYDRGISPKEAVAEFIRENNL